MAVRPSFFAELKRRNVLRASVLYIGAVWALSQGIAQLGPLFDAPNWAMRAFVIACAIGFPFWVAFAWFYEFTPQGIKRESDVASSASITHSTARKLDFAIIAVLVVAVALLASGYFVHRKPATSAAAVAAIPAQSIAVLPFENLSADKDNEYFVAGMQDLILTKLADIGSLKVIARTSTQSYGSHPENLTLVGQQLGVATILEGSVQKAGNEVLINVQLIDAKTDSHIWAESYTRTLDNIFGVEGEVAGKIADALNAKLSPVQSAELAAVPTTNHAAYDAFLRAEYQANQGYINYDTGNLKAAIPLYRQAIAQDPQFALAFARLSMVETELAWAGGGGDDPRQLFAQARADAGQALKLAPDLPAAYNAMGSYDDQGNADYVGALKAFAAAIKLKPNDVGALTSQGYVQRRMGHVAAALVSLEQAFTLDPRNSNLAVILAQTYMMAGRWTDAEAALQRALAIDPHNLQAKVYYSKAILWGGGDVAGALAAAQGDAPALKLLRVSLLTYQRKYPAALALLDSVPDTPDNFSVNGGSKALVQADLYRYMNDPVKARPLYQQALAAAQKALPRQQGILQAFAWQNLANAELGLGQTRKGLQAIAQSLAIVDASGDRVYGDMLMANAAGLYGQAGRADLAVPLLDKALAMYPSSRSASGLWLWLIPQLDPIRHDPGFEALQKKYAKYKPAVTYDAAPAASASTAERPVSSSKPIPTQPSP